MRKLLAIPALIATAALILACLSTFGLHFNPEIKFGDILSVYSATFLAFVIQVIFARRGKAEDGQRSLVADCLKEFVAAVAAVRYPVAAAIGPCFPSAPEAQAVLLAFEECQMQWSILETAVYQAHNQALTDACYELNRIVIKFKGELTGGNFPFRVFSASDLESAGFFRQEVLKSGQQVRLTLNKS